MNRISGRISSLNARSFSTNTKKNVVLVDGCRIPFAMGGTTYSNYIAVDLARLALKGLTTKTAIDPASIDMLFFGTGNRKDHQKVNCRVKPPTHK